MKKSLAYRWSSRFLKEQVTSTHSYIFIFIAILFLITFILSKEIYPLFLAILNGFVAFIFFERRGFQEIITEKEIEKIISSDS